MNLRNISLYESIRRSRKNGHQRRTFSERVKSISTTSHHSLSSGAAASISPCGPQTKLCPQNCMPLVCPEGSGSCPTRLTATTGSPLATACPRWEIIHASCCRFLFLGGVGAFPADGRRVDEHVGSLQCHEAGCFRDTIDPNIPIPPVYRWRFLWGESQIAGGEIEFLVIGRVVRYVHFTILSGDRTIGVEHDCCVVV